MLWSERKDSRRPSGFIFMIFISINIFLKCAIVLINSMIIQLNAQGIEKGLDAEIESFTQMLSQHLIM